MRPTPKINGYSDCVPDNDAQTFEKSYYDNWILKENLTYQELPIYLLRNLLQYLFINKLEHIFEKF